MGVSGLKLRLNVLVLTLLYLVNLQGQNKLYHNGKDTVYVVDTVYVQDTIFIQKIEISPLYKDKSNFLVSESATISNFSILSKSIINLQNVQEMKSLKNLVLGCLSMVFAETTVAQLNIQVGGSIKSNGTNLFIRSGMEGSSISGYDYASAMHVGIGYNWDVLKQKISLGLGLQYYYQFQSNEYIVKNSSTLVYVSRESQNTISMPLMLRYNLSIKNKKIFQPVLGIELAKPLDNGEVRFQKNNVDIFIGSQENLLNIGLMAGFDTRINQHFDLKVLASCIVTGNELLYTSQEDVIAFNRGPGRVDIGLRYQFPRKEKVISVQ